MRRIVLAAVAAAGCFLVAGGPALADSIDFSQFGPDGTIYGTSISGTTVDGVSFTITGPSEGFESLIANSPDYGPSQFAAGTPLLFDNSGAVTIDFATPISSISSLGAEANAFGPFTATLQAYDGAGYLGSSSYYTVGTTDGETGTAFEGTLPSLSFSSPGITEIVIDTTNEGDGFALGLVPAGAVPEPATWALMLGGFGLLGGALRSSRRRSASAAA